MGCICNTFIRKINNHNKMLEYAYVILRKLSFDKELFTKELKKCISYLNTDEAKQLKDWVKINYTHEYAELRSCF